MAIKGLATAESMVVVLLVCSGLCAAQVNGYFKAECSTSAGYLLLGSDGTYTVTWREHMGIFVEEQGRWEQKDAVITFAPAKPAKAPYQGTQVRYKGKTFLSWASEGAPGIVIPIEETKQELDHNSGGLPLYVFFKTTAKVYQRETKQTYPFHFIKPPCLTPRKKPIPAAGFVTAAEATDG